MCLGAAGGALWATGYRCVCASVRVLRARARACSSIHCLKNVGPPVPPRAHHSHSTPPMDIEQLCACSKTTSYLVRPVFYGGTCHEGGNGRVVAQVKKSTQTHQIARFGLRIPKGGLLGVRVCVRNGARCPTSLRTSICVCVKMGHRHTRHFPRIEHTKSCGILCRARSTAPQLAHALYLTPPWMLQNKKVKNR